MWKCDFCGSENITLNNVHLTIKDNDTDNEYHKFDTCGDCMTRVNNFITKMKQTAGKLPLQET